MKVEERKGPLDNKKLEENSNDKDGEAQNVDREAGVLHKRNSTHKLSMLARFSSLKYSAINPNTMLDRMEQLSNS